MALRAIQIATRDFRVQERLRMRERQADLVTRGASRTMHSRHLTGRAVDLVALDGGEVSWQWEDYFRGAAFGAILGPTHGRALERAGCRDRNGLIDAGSILLSYFACGAYFR